MSHPQKQNQATDPVAPARWGVHWGSPTKMLFGYLVVVLLAVGNHLYFSALDGEIATNQSWKFRTGTAFANLFQILFSLSIGQAFSQRTWRTLRRKFLTLEGIDNLLTAPNNHLSIFCPEILLKAKLAMFIAALTWLSPIIPIIAPASLSVAPQGTTTTPTAPIRIGNLNFSRPINQTDPSQINIVETWVVPGINFPTRKRQPQQYSGPPSYGKVRNRATALILETVYGGQIVQAPSPCGENCTFTQSFVGPAYKCVDKDPYDTDSPWCSPDASSDCSYAWTDFPGQAITFYEASNSSTDFCKSYSSNPAACGDYDGVQAWENGNIWMRHKYLPDKWRSTYLTGYVPQEAWLNYSFRCDQWDARFDIRRTYVRSLQQVEVNTTFLNRIQYGPITRVGPEYDGPTVDNYVGPNQPDYVGYNETDYAGFALHETLYSILAGGISYANAQLYDTAELDGTKLVEAVPFPADGVRKPVQNLRELVEQLHVNATISLLSIENLAYLESEPATNLVVTIYPNVFQYDRVALLLTYCLALFFGLLALLVGIEALFTNGVSMNVGFLSILMTTRNKTLDDLARGACLGAEPMPETLRKTTKVKFGVIESGGLVAHDKDGVQSAETETETSSFLKHAAVGEKRVDVAEGLPKGPKHAAFGVKDVDVVEDLQKGAPYV